MNQAQLTTVKVTSQFILPFIVIVAGALVWWKRR